MEAANFINYGISIGNIAEEAWRSPSEAEPTSPPLPPPLSTGSSPSLDFSMSSFSLSPIDFDPLPNIFFNACPPSYKDFSMCKEKNPHDMADVLLSLKHAVVHPVHPQLTVSGALPPLSPLSSLGSYGQVQSGASPPTMPYSMSYPGSQMFSTPGYSQYGSCLESQPPPPANPQPVPAGNVFPSMSLNVSMNMTMGMPGMSYGSEQCPPTQHQVSCWNAGPTPGVPPPGPSPHNGGMTYGQVPPNFVNPIHMAYNNNGVHPNYTASGSYSFTAEFRPLPSDPSVSCAEKEFSYKNMSSNVAYKANKSSGYGFVSPQTGGRTRNSNTSKTGTSSVTQIPVAPEVGMKTNLCRICGKTYARPSTLKTHMRTHSGEKPYRCSTCNKSFSQAANLTAHIRTHSGEKPFRCPICDRRFSQSSSVTTHMRTHSGERPYRCRLCKKAFSDSSTLTKHLRIHSGEKPYQCKLCLLRFSQSGNLNRHMRIHTTAA